MTAAGLHIVYDPLCGWCYAAAPLMTAAASIPDLAIVLHAGGMLAGAQRRSITADWREHVLPHDRRIEQLSGQPFGDAYLDGLLRDTGAMLDSEPPITAVLAAQSLAAGDPGRAGLAMLERLQRAHYVEGRHIADEDVLFALAVERGFDEAEFRAAWERLRGAPTHVHIDASRRLLAELGGRGFPTIALATSGTAPRVLDMGPYLGKPDAWRAMLARLVTTGAGDAA